MSSAAKPLIAVAGATGRVGGEVLRLLARDAVELVALTRRPDEAQGLEGAAVAAVDFAHPQTLQKALAGADRLFLAQGTSPQQAANEIALIDAAVAAGVGHIVKLSAIGPSSRLFPFAWHMEIEAHLARQPIASTALRPSAFPDILIRRAGPHVGKGKWITAAGEGRVNFIDTRDVAKAARVALLDEVGRETQRAFHLTGPRAWTMREVSDELAKRLGHPVVHETRSLDQQRSALLAEGMAPFVADLLVGLDQMFRDSAIGETTSTFEELTGEAPQGLESWLSENIAAFRR